MFPYAAKTQIKSCIQLSSFSSRNVTSFKSSSTSVTSQSFIKRFSSVKSRPTRSESYPSDLKHTLLLTFQMISTVLQGKENVLLEKVKKIEETQRKKDKIREEKKKVKTKILLDSQICEENKRRKEGKKKVKQCLIMR